jgi:hypothetical protein
VKVDRRAAGREGTGTAFYMEAVGRRRSRAAAMLAARRALSGERTGTSSL